MVAPTTLESIVLERNTRRNDMCRLYAADSFCSLDQVWRYHRPDKPRFDPHGVNPETRGNCATNAAKRLAGKKKGRRHGRRRPVDEAAVRPRRLQ
jgi:hypothetical protein